MSRDTIRFYERRGLIAQAPRPSGSNSYKSYDEASLQRLCMIRYCKRLGFTLAELQQLTQLWGERRFTAEAKRQALEAKRVEIEQRQLELQAIHEALLVQIQQL